MVKTIELDGMGDKVIFKFPSGKEMVVSMSASTDRDYLFIHYVRDKDDYTKTKGYHLSGGTIGLRLEKY